MLNNKPNNMQPTSYTEFNGKVCIAASEVIERGIATLPIWKKWTREAKANQYVTRPGGNGRASLIELKAIPTKYREQIISTLGNPEKSFNPLDEFFTMDANARAFYDNFRHTNGKALEPYQISKYTINASVLNALGRLKAAREFLTKRMGNTRRNLKDGLTNDCIAFNEVLKIKQAGAQHTLPKNPRKLMDKLNEYVRTGYNCLIDGRANNTNAQVVTPEMIKLWNDMFAGQRHKPTHIEVSARYEAFLLGKIEIVCSETGEVYDPKAEHFKAISESSVYNYLSEWKHRIVTHSKRSGDRQKFMGKYIPHGTMDAPEFAGSIVSVDDRQPPFKWGDGAGNRMWFYMAQDLGSTAFTTWVYGDTKEGIITDFYRAMVRNYATWGLSLPYEIECEASLNSSFKDTFLSPGAMFQETRIIANMARTKRIERTFGTLRNGYESKHEEFMSRPHAQAEHLQLKAGKQKFLPKEQIVELELRLIEKWNNELHPNQLLHPGLSRWDVFMQKQHPELKPINWAGILPHLGYYTPSSMHLGRVQLQGDGLMVGFDGKVALGEQLLNVMSEAEGQDVDVFWMDDHNGNVLKAHVYNKDGRFLCELVKLKYHRAKLEQTPQCLKNLGLTAAYRETVEGYANRMGKEITPITIIENEPQQEGRFVMPGLEKRQVREMGEVEILPEVNPNDLVIVPQQDSSLYDRF